MNFGAMVGFTKRLPPPGGESLLSPRLRVIFVPDWFTTDILRSENVNCLLLIDSPSPKTLTVQTNSGILEGESIHISQWGAEQVTIAAGTGVTVRVATGLVAATRAQFSTLVLIKTSDINQEYLVVGDPASA